jgi:hypothetical protein
MVFIEAPGANVFLEHPQSHAVRLKGLGVLQQHGTKSPTLRVGIYVQVVEPALREAGEPHDSASDLYYPDFVSSGDPAAKFGAIVVGNTWQVRHRIPGANEDASDDVGISNRPVADGGFQL